MDTQQSFPQFDVKCKELNQFILRLVEEFKKGKIQSWEILDERVKSFFTDTRMDLMESIAPGWRKMASYTNGITLTHITCAFLGMFILPEFQGLSQERQQIAKWIILFHDIDKIHIEGKKDFMHAFRSAAVAANTLPNLGFPISNQYHERIKIWTEFTINAFIWVRKDLPPKPDNQKLPDILAGIEQLYGENTPATLIIKTTLLHISLNVDPFYDTPAPLTEDETKRYINSDLFPLLNHDVDR